MVFSSISERLNEYSFQVKKANKEIWEPLLYHHQLNDQE